MHAFHAIRPIHLLQNPAFLWAIHIARARALCMCSFGSAGPFPLIKPLMAGGADRSILPKKVRGPSRAVCVSRG